MLQIVVDTNVLVAATRSRLGASSTLLRMLNSGAFEINLSVALVLEYEEVLKRGGRTSPLRARDVDVLVTFLCATANCHKSVERSRPLLADPDDDFVGELALACRCDRLVTHNLRDFASIAGRVRVVTPGELLSELRGEP